MEDQADQSCFVAGISTSFQKSFLYYINWISPVTMLLSIWCFVSNASVIIALFRSGIWSIRSGLLMVCSLAFTDLLWGATVGSVHSGFRIKNFLNRQVCDVYSQLDEIPMYISLVTCVCSTLGNLAIISIDRYLAVTSFLQYKFLVTQCRTLTACALVWLWSITMGTVKQVSAIPFKPFNVLLSVFMILTAAVIVITQIMTIRSLRRHNNEVAVIMEEGNQVNPVNTVNATIERKLTRTMTYVVGALGLVFIPCACIVAASFITGKMILRPYFSILYFPLLTMCSGINPVLYYRGNSNVKEGISKLLKCE